jgi:hypothetical protein
MSHVDNVILSFSILEDERPIMESVNEWLRAHVSGQSFGPDLVNADGAYGGAKCLETPLFIAAFNYLPEDAFLGFLRTLPWRCPGEVQVIVQRQNDDVFEILSPFTSRAGDASHPAAA